MDQRSKALSFYATSRRKSEVVGSNPTRKCQKSTNFFFLFNLILMDQSIVEIELNPNFKDSFHNFLWKGFKNK